MVHVFVDIHTGGRNRRLMAVDRIPGEYVSDNLLTFCISGDDEPFEAYPARSGTAAQNGVLPFMTLYFYERAEMKLLQQDNVTVQEIEQITAQLTEQLQKQAETHSQTEVVPDSRLKELGYDYIPLMG